MAKEQKGVLSSLRSLFPISRRVAMQTGVVEGPAAIQALESALQPLAGKGRNRYEAYKEFLRMDPEANNAVTRLALLTQYAYKGVCIRPGAKMEDAEKTLLENAQKEALAMDFRSKFYAIARHLIRDGDEIFICHWEQGLKQWQPLPIGRLTIVENEGQISVPSAQIFKEVIYVLNEMSPDAIQKFPENDNQKVYHISINNYGEEVYDLLGRYTFGVWSESPMECLKSRILWKQAILITDILWRYRNVPREVHELDVSHIKFENFTGDTVEERLGKYQQAIQNYLQVYAAAIQKKKVDQGYVITKGTKIYYTEPTRVAYTSPNEVTEQINESIREGLGQKAGKGTYATEIAASSYIILLPDMMAYKIKNVLLEILRRQMAEKYKTSTEDLNKLDLRLSLVLDILRGELVRQMAVLSAAHVHTRDELREKVGDDPLTDEQKAELDAEPSASKGGRTGDNAQTIADILATTQRTEEPQEPITPESRHDKQVT